MTWTPSSRASRLATMCFVSWSAAIAENAIAPSAAHCMGPAASERCANETGDSPFVDEPTRTSKRRAGSFIPAPAPAEPPPPLLARLRRAYAGSRALRLARVVDAERRPGIGLEALGRDLAAAGGARAVGPGLDPLQRRVDLRQHVLGVLAERVVDLAAERRRRG